ncbi:putative MFS-type transporter Pynfp [[Candida] railenensis]|uniref:MFS-type transporter Pynfp n=1 Tax=[Candida] railenensis TaxID=45579 RepID=A0A9P0QW16_9ASCO|nr:putative MFS-type transporter Pynfp [[Candida] railenensis]
MNSNTNYTRNSGVEEFALDSLTPEDITTNVSTTSLEIVSESDERKRGMMCVAAGFTCNFMIFGIAFSYGVFQDFYTSEIGPLKSESASMVALIGTLGTALTYAVGVFNNSLTYYLSCTKIMLIGSTIMSLGLILTGFANQYYQFLLTQGIMFGIGSSFLYLPPVVCAPAYFDKNRSIAMGIVFSGTGFGGLAMAAFSRYLIAHVGWRWCVRILGFMNLFVTGAASFLVYEPKTFNSVAHSRGLFKMNQLGSLKVWLQLLASFLQSAGYLIPLIYMSKYGQTLGFSLDQGALFIGVNNAVNAIFKVIIGYAADRLGRLNMITVCSLLSATTIFGLWLISTRETFISFIVLYGVFTGAIIALLPTCLVELFGLQNYQSLSGLMYFARGIGSLCGSPIAGLFITGGGSKSSEYRGSIIYNGALLLASSICLIALRTAVAFPKQKFKWKV